MAEKKVIELEIKTDSVKSLKAQLREAQSEVSALSEKFGATSQEAVNAAKKAALLKDAIGDAKNLTDAYNPDAKFNALSQSLTGVLNGFQAFQGALGLVGVEGKAVEESLLKVQSAMALAQGVSGVMESIDSFKTLGTQIKNLTIVQKLSTAAQWLWNAAMNANPLGAIVLAITAVIVAGYKLISFFQESAAENERMAKSIDKHAAALKKQQQQIESSATKQAEYNKFQYDYAKASGASAEELRKLAIRHQNEQIALANKNKELAKSTYLREQDILATMTANDADEELIEKQKEIVKQARENATKAREAAVQENKDLIALKRQQSVELRQEQTDADKKKIEDAKENRKKAADKLLKDEKENNDKFNEELKRAQKEREFILTDDIEEGLRQQLVDSEAEKDKIRQEAIAKQEEDELELMQFRGDIYKQNIDNADEAAKKQLDIEKALAEQKRAIQLQGLDVALQGVNLIKNVFEKQKGVQKAALLAESAIGIAKMIISNKAANAGALASPANILVPGSAAPIIALNNISTGIGIAANIAATAKALKSLGGGSPESAPAPSGGGGSTSGGAVAPNFNIVGNAQSQNPLAGLGSSPIKAYVVSGEVTTAQSLDRQKVYSATFG